MRRLEHDAERIEQLRDVLVIAVPGVGHRLTYPGGPAHPLWRPPAWVTEQGVDLQRLQQVQLAYQLQQAHADAVAELCVDEGVVRHAAP